MPRFTVTVTAELREALVAFARENGIRPATAATMLLRRALSNYLPEQDRPVADRPVADRPVADRPVADRPTTPPSATDRPAETEILAEQTTP